MGGRSLTAQHPHPHHPQRLDPTRRRAATTGEVVVHPDLAGALTALEHHLLTADTPTPDTAVTGAGSPTCDQPQPATPTLLLATAPAGRGDAARLAVLLRAGRPHRICTVLIGPWPHGTTHHVDHAGRLNPPTPAGTSRVTILTPAACADLLATLRPTTPPATAVSRCDNHRDTVPAGPSTGAAPLRLHTGERIQLTTATGQPVPLPRSAATDVLALLATHPDGLDRDSILDAIWPDTRHKAAVMRLHKAVSCLRGTAANITSIPLIHRTNGRYRLNPAAIDTTPLPPRP